MRSKAITLFILLLVFAAYSYAQVAVNNTGAAPSSSAMLDISASDKGILIPRMIITDVDSDISPVENPEPGLLIYNTGASGVPEGFYYWSNSKWNQITNGESSLTVNQLAGLYETAELYEDNDFSSPSSIYLSSSSFYYGWTTALVGETFGQTSVNNTNAIADQVIIGEDGIYEVDVSASFGGSNNVQVTGAVFRTPAGGSATRTKVRFLVKLKENGDLEGSTAHGLLRLNTDDILDFRFNSTSNGETLNLYNISMVVNKVGD